MTGHVGVGDEQLGALEAVPVEIEPGGHGHGLGSEGAVGLGQGRHDHGLATAHLGQQVGPGGARLPAQDLAGDDRRGQVGARHQGAPELLVDDGQVDDAGPGPAQGLGVGEAEPVQPGHLRPQVGLVAQGVSFELADRGQRAAGFEQVAGDAAQLELPVVEVEVHGRSFPSSMVTGAVRGPGWPAPCA